MSLIYHKNDNAEVTFADYLLHAAENSYPEDGVCSENGKSLEGYDRASVYVCPHCIKNYGLYAECNTDENEINAFIKFIGMFGETADSTTCEVENCGRHNALGGSISTTLCRITHNHNGVEKADFKERFYER